MFHFILRQPFSWRRIAVNELTMSLKSRSRLPLYEQIYSYIMTGKFKAPSSEWKHQNFQLTDYELIVMTEGTLYLNYNSENFIVKNGEYLLLPPSSS